MGACESSTPQSQSRPNVEPLNGNFANIKTLESKDILLKIIVLGDGGVGKTSLLHKVTSPKTQVSGVYKATIGADFLTKEFIIDKRRVTAQIWDTAGQERYESLGCAYFRGADACVLVFSVNNPESFDHLENWREKFIVHSRSTRSRFVYDSPPPAFMVLANQIDSVQVNDPAIQNLCQRASAWCNENSIPFFETSALNGRNVLTAFQTITETSLSNIIDSEAQNSANKEDLFSD